MLLNNNENEAEKTKLPAKKSWGSYRKISVSDHHLELRNNPWVVPNFLQLSSASSYREGSNPKALNGSGFTQMGSRIGSRRMSLGNVLERRDRKNGVAGISKCDR